MSGLVDDRWSIYDRGHIWEHKKILNGAETMSIVNHHGNKWIPAGAMGSRRDVLTEWRWQRMDKRSRWFRSQIELHHICRIMAYDETLRRVLRWYMPIFSIYRIPTSI